LEVSNEEFSKHKDTILGLKKENIAQKKEIKKLERACDAVGEEKEMGEEKYHEAIHAAKVTYLPTMNPDPDPDTNRETLAVTAHHNHHDHVSFPRRSSKGS